MKSSIWYACVIAALIMWTATFGVIQYDDDHDESYDEVGGVTGNSGHHYAWAESYGDNAWGAGYGVSKKP